MAMTDPSGTVPLNDAPVQKSDDAAGYYTPGDNLVDPIAPTVGPDAPRAEQEADVERMCVDWMDAVEPWMREHYVHWHMLQKVYVDDVDMDRVRAKRAETA